MIVSCRHKKLQELFNHVILFLEAFRQVGKWNPDFLPCPVVSDVIFIVQSRLIVPFDFPSLSVSDVCGAMPDNEVAALVPDKHHFYGSDPDTTLASHKHVDPVNDPLENVAEFVSDVRLFVMLAVVIEEAPVFLPSIGDG